MDSHLFELVICSLFLALGLGIAAPACVRFCEEDRQHPQEKIEALAEKWVEKINPSSADLSCGHYPPGGMGRCVVEWVLPSGNVSVTKLQCSIEKNECWEM